MEEIPVYTLSMAVGAGFGLVSAWLIEIAWNGIVPAMFHGPHIDYITACLLCLSLVCGLIVLLKVRSSKT